MDNPLPSGTSLAAEALLWLSMYTGEPGLRTAAEQAIRDSAGLVRSYPSGIGHLLAVLTSLDAGMREVAVIGPEAIELGHVVWERFRPQAVLAVDNDGSDGEIVPLLADRPVGEDTLAFVCEGFVCRLPVGDSDSLRQELE